MKSILFSLSENKDYFEVITCQIVRLIKNNKILKMSKREGNFVTLEEVYKSVGTDALRYFMISTRSETSMDFEVGVLLPIATDSNGTSEFASGK